MPAYVVRLMRVDGGEVPRGGHVTYHVEAAGTTVSLPAAQLDGDDPSRAHFATVDGLRDLFTWAHEALAGCGVAVTGPVTQRKTWNLAALFRLPTERGPVWLKALPAFATDEARVMAELAAVDPTLVPEVLASGEGKLLLTHLPGEDCWHASEDVLAAGIHRYVAAQAALTPPTWLRHRDYPAEIDALLDRDLGLTADEVARARALLPGWAALADCGLPATVVHGDFHSGNWRSDGGPPAVLDFADAHVGAPVLDGLRVTEFGDTARTPAAHAAWVSAWRAERPGSDPARALVVGAPLARLYLAVRYQEFLDGIEASERIYHEGDPASCVRAALRSHAAARTGT
ncbi:aminoglycoside phosphotransferase family protein [Actinophytocola sp. NPDC049390]|uniref:aminoglycoside phosphotransferase family protein n=1 Tax=Actinophytocola sp. NPDC049390 TaxID=3363894 RepID=UPI00379BAEE4